MEAHAEAQTEAQAGGDEPNPLEPVKQLRITPGRANGVPADDNDTAESLKEGVGTKDG